MSNGANEDDKSRNLRLRGSELLRRQFRIECAGKELTARQHLATVDQPLIRRGQAHSRLSHRSGAPPVGQNADDCMTGQDFFSSYKPTLLALA